MRTAFPDAVMAGRMALLLVLLSTLSVSSTGGADSPCRKDSSFYAIIDKSAQPCPEDVCSCQCSIGDLLVDCQNQNLTDVPENMSDFTGKLSLDGNRFRVLANNFLPKALRPGLAFSTLSMQDCFIEEIHSKAFYGSLYLETIDLSNNNIFRIDTNAFLSLRILRQLILKNNKLKYIYTGTFGSLSNLALLDVSGNQVEAIENSSFESMRLLGHLYLNGNKIKRMREYMLSGLKTLQLLDLSWNAIHQVYDRAFDAVPLLEELLLEGNKLNESFLMSAFSRPSAVVRMSLRGNEIKSIDERMFSNFSKIETLNLVGNRISKISGSPFKEMKHLKELYMGGNSLGNIPSDMFDESAKGLELLHLQEQHQANGSGLMFIAPGAFKHLTSLQHLRLDMNSLTRFDDDLFTPLRNLIDLQAELNQFLVTFPVLKGLSKLDRLNLQLTEITEIPADLCTWIPMLTYMDISFSHVKKVPDFRQCKELGHLFLDVNSITHQALGTRLNGLSKLMDLTMSSNELGRITNSTFSGLTRLEHLDLSENPISDISDGAFSSARNMTSLNLKDSKFPKLPTDGLQKVETLVIDGNAEMITFPDIDKFPSLRIAKLNYPYHCCMWREFIKPENSETGVDDVYSYPSDKTPIASKDGSKDGFVLDGHYQWKRDVSLDYDDDDDDDGFSNDMFDSAVYPDYSSGSQGPTIQQYRYVAVDNRQVTCSPVPNALTPCDDLLEHWWLRGFVWLFMIVSLSANAVVFGITVTTRSRQPATQTARFFVAFLAIADFFLGLYLAFIAFVDILTTGEYAQHALKWKISSSCQAAGFFAVFGSALSIWTLTAITLDRVLAVTFAVRRYKISKTKARFVMTVGVMAATVIAVLPLVGVSRYTDVGVCLPFDISTSAAKIYVTFILVLPLVAVLIIGCSYYKLYRIYSHSSAWNPGETRVAFRVALLVFFNCACWIPISVIGLLVVYGNRSEIVQTSALEDDSGKISLFVAKVLVAIFFPINAVVDPFFYAISTPFFRRDITNLLKKFKTKIQAINIRRSQTSSRSGRRPSLSSVPGPGKVNVSNRGITLNANNNNPRGSLDNQPVVPLFGRRSSVTTKETVVLTSFAQRQSRLNSANADRVSDIQSVESASRNTVQNNASASETSSNYIVNVIQTTADTHDDKLQCQASANRSPCLPHLHDGTANQLSLDPQSQDVSSQEDREHLQEVAVSSTVAYSHQTVPSSDFDESHRPQQAKVAFKNIVARLSLSNELGPEVFMAQETSV